MYLLFECVSYIQDPICSIDFFGRWGGFKGGGAGARLELEFLHFYPIWDKIFDQFMSLAAPGKILCPPLIERTGNFQIIIGKQGCIRGPIVHVVVYPCETLSNSFQDMSSCTALTRHLGKKTTIKAKCIKANISGLLL